MGDDTRPRHGVHYRRPPEPIDAREWNRFERSDRLKHLAARLRADRDGLRHGMIMSGLDRAEQASVPFLVADDANPEFDRDHYIKFFNMTAPVIVAPKILQPTPAFALAWSLPVLESFYTEWWHDDIRAREWAGTVSARAFGCGQRHGGYRPYRVHSRLSGDTRMHTTGNRASKRQHPPKRAVRGISSAGGWW